VGLLILKRVDKRGGETFEIKFVKKEPVFEEEEEGEGCVDRGGFQD